MGDTFLRNAPDGSTGSPGGKVAEGKELQEKKKEKIIKKFYVAHGQTVREKSGSRVTAFVLCERASQRYRENMARWRQGRVGAGKGIATQPQFTGSQGFGTPKGVGAEKETYHVSIVARLPRCSISRFLPVMISKLRVY